MLKVGSGTRGETKDETGEAREGLVAVILGSVASAGLAIVTRDAHRRRARSPASSASARSASSGYNIAWSLALLGAGHLVGLSVGMAMLAGLVIAWAIAVPILTSMQPAAAGVTLAAHTTTIWRTQVRFIGAGAIAVAAIYTLATLAKPVVGGLVSTLAASRATGHRRRARSRPLAAVDLSRSRPRAWSSPAWLAFTLRAVDGARAERDRRSRSIAVPFVLLGGFLIAGDLRLHGGTDRRVEQPDLRRRHSVDRALRVDRSSLAVAPTAETRPALVAFALFITAIVFACATISNDNLQDLKTGQLVGASPMRQQIALIVGVGAGAAVIPSVLNLLAKAYGFAGAANVGVVAPNPLPAPQATLISALAQGVIGGNLDWKMIGIGALVGVGLILLDATLGAMKKLRIPPLAVGIGIYLPMSATFAVVVGAVRRHWYDGRARAIAATRARRATRHARRVGADRRREPVGRAQRRPDRRLRKDAPIALVAENFAPAPVLGVLGFVARSWRCTRGSCGAPSRRAAET